MNQNKRTIKILHLRSSGGFYGAEAVIFNVARELDQMGCVNHICCINNLDNPNAELVEKAQASGIAASSADAITLLDHETIQEIREKLSNGHFDVMHCHDYKASIYGLLAARKMDIRRVVTNHLWDAVDWKLWLYQRIEGFSYNLFDRVIAVSEQVKKDIRPFIIHKSKIEVIENGVDCAAFYTPAQRIKDQGSRIKENRNNDSNKRSAFGLRDDDFVIGIVGRLARQKGHEYLLKAMALLLAKDEGLRLKDEGVEKTQDVSSSSSSSSSSSLSFNLNPSSLSLKLLIIGDGPLEDKLKSLCEQLGLSCVDLRETDTPASALSAQCSVVFAGSQSDMPSVYQALDLLVMPSLEEGLPMVLLEAMASGVPVVATPVGQIPHIVKDGETGFLVEPKDVEGLADVLGKMIEGRRQKGDQVSLEKIAQNARKLVEEKYSSRAMAKKYLEIYEWLVE